ncbi:hypothetical protein ACFQ10_04615 [Streptomyces indonesiensis]
MTSPSDENVSATQQALGELAADRADESALNTLANSEVLLPPPRPERRRTRRP